MIKKLPASKGPVIGIEVSGKIDSTEEDKWIEIFDNLIEANGSINVLVLIDGKLTVTADTAYDDLIWTLENLKHIERLAIVSESKVLKWLVTADSPFGKLTGISEKHFETRHLKDAWHWLEEPA